MVTAQHCLSRFRRGGRPGMFPPASQVSQRRQEHCPVCHFVRANTPGDQFGLGSWILGETIADKQYTIDP